MARLWSAIGVFVLAITAVAVPARAADLGLGRLVMPGPVTQAHARIEAACERCHAPFDKDAQPRLCTTCHASVASDLRTRSGLHGRQREQRCSVCHAEHEGRNANILGLDAHRFDHRVTDFPLLGAHTRTRCADCHAAGKPHRQAATACIGCHARDDAHTGRLGRACQQCHAPANWKVQRFDHARTRFALDGAHAPLRCADCHVRGIRQQRLGTSCIDCHRADDVHRGRSGTACADCHVTSAWKPASMNARFDHVRTGFPLTGAHGRAACRDCHRAGTGFGGLQATCSSCHRERDAHRGTLSAPCGSCHGTAAWKPANVFDHVRTPFPLLGAHRRAACRGCHADPAHYRGTPHACVDCHRADDVHRGRNGAACGDCHRADAWKGTRFDHARQTRFPLQGAHRAAGCGDCHRSPTFEDAPPRSCVGCHEQDDPHAAQLVTTCEQCHAETSWKPARFDHARARFALAGAHVRVPCADCHRTARYRDTQRTCAGCHADDDAHAGSLGSDCGRCHNVRAWALGSFDHALTRFPLDGAHARSRCADCHRRATADAPALAQACVSCHAKDDAHDGGFGRQCERCHGTASFRVAGARGQRAPAAQRPGEPATGAR